MSILFTPLNIPKQVYAFHCTVEDYETLSDEQVEFLATRVTIITNEEYYFAFFSLDEYNQFMELSGP